MDESVLRVQVNEGLLEGNLEVFQNGSYISFKGIPYAKPPVGNLRFSAPQSPESWEGIRDATEHSDNCMQMSMLGDSVIVGSEDCLYLNVYTPNIKKNSSSKFPVMIFIHGGAFLNGSGDTMMHGPEYLVSQNVILVTINYRLEALGFLCVDTEDVPGNAGLKDQVAAMKWVKENISRFGGDSNNITIFGESAGSASVSYHLLSPMSKNLFHAAIAQSGVCTSSWTKSSNAINKAFILGKILGKDTNDPKDLIEFLRTVPASDLVGVTSKVLEKDKSNNYSDLIMAFLPVVEKNYLSEKSFINKPPKELLSKGEINSVPLIIGCTNGEGMFLISNVIKMTQKINKNFAQYVRGISGKMFSENAANKVKSFYFKNLEFSEKTLENMVHLRTDFMFGYDTYNFAKEFACKSKFPVYFYVFSCRSELNVLEMLYGAEGLNLTAHGEDLFYLFSSSFTKTIDFSSEAGMMASKILNLWTNMAKFRNPTPSRNNKIVAKWDPISVDKFSFMHMSDKFEIRINPFKERMEFLDDLHSYEELQSKY